MSCAITSGKTLGCRTGIGGIKSSVKIAIDDIDYDSVTIVDGVITAISANSGKRGYEFHYEDESSNFGDVGTGNRQAGTFTSTQTLTESFTDMTQETTQLLRTLSKNRCLTIVRYKDGTNKVAGYETGMMVDTITHNSGTAGEDKNGADVVWTAKEKEMAYNISNALVESLLVAAS